MAAAEKKKKEVFDDDEDNDKENAEPAKPKGSKLPLVIIIILLVIILAGGGAAAYFLFFKKSETTGEKVIPEKVKPQEIIFYPMDPYIVNLVDNEGERYVKIVLQLELSDKQIMEDLKAINPKLRDAILDLLSSKTYKEMMDPLGKQRLRDEIIMRMNAIINSPRGKVTKVYFTEFVIQ